MPSRDRTPDYERLVAQETLILDATEAIVGLLEEAGVSRQELARRLGKSKGFVSQLLSGERNMTLRTLADLGHVLGRRFSLSSRSTECDGQLGRANSVERSHSIHETPEDLESRAEAPVETVQEWQHAGGADAHEYALAA
jgi:transcriptional regulator with XRE-family HTH domain